MDLAVGVIIGGAFGTIVSSLTNDLIMPIVGMFGSADFNNNFIPLPSSVTATTLDPARQRGPVLAWGSFVTAVINFPILGFIIFMMMKAVNRLLSAAGPKQAPKPPPATAAQETLLAEIRDILTAQASGKGAARH
jgi:large conductance mechanosensitive channel